MARYATAPTPGTHAWPPDNMWDPCADGHSDDEYRDAWGDLCCRRCGRDVTLDWSRRYRR